MIICNLCKNELKVIVKTETEYKDCRACNLGVFSSSCSCQIITKEITEYFCDNCKINLDICKSCNNYFDKLLFNKCESCFNQLKLDNPSDNNNKYKFIEEIGDWRQILKRCQCCKELLPSNNYDHYVDPESKKKINFGKYRGKTYGYLFYNDIRYSNWCINQSNPSLNMKDYNNYAIKEKINPTYFSSIRQCRGEDINCVLCNLDTEIEKLRENYNDYIFTIKNEYHYNIKFKKKCICNQYTHWIDIFNLTNSSSNNIIQCQNCNPSTKYEKYEWTHSNTWRKQQIGRKCNRCNNILWNDRSYNWSSIQQCIDCDPKTDFIKFKFEGTGWNYDRYKTFDGKRHNWKKCPSNISIDYKCSCPKCN